MVEFVGVASAILPGMVWWHSCHRRRGCDQYIGHPLPGGTANWSNFRPVTTRNRSVTIDFDRRQPLSRG
ncbi:hypothetical protein B296_00031212, partial [Ensete ventricosum]